LSLGALPGAHAHGDAVRAADGARRGRAHDARLGRRVRRGGDRLGDVLHDHGARRDPEPPAARVAAKPRAFRGAGKKIVKVMAGLVPAIHVLKNGTAVKVWMPATSA